MRGVRVVGEEGEVCGRHGVGGGVVWAPFGHFMEAMLTISPAHMGPAPRTCARRGCPPHSLFPWFFSSGEHKALWKQRSAETESVVGFLPHAQATLNHSKVLRRDTIIDLHSIHQTNRSISQPQDPPHVGTTFRHCCGEDS